MLPPSSQSGHPPLRPSSNRSGSSLPKAHGLDSFGRVTKAIGRPMVGRPAKVKKNDVHLYYPSNESTGLRAADATQEAPLLCQSPGCHRPS